MSYHSHLERLLRHRLALQQDLLAPGIGPVVTKVVQRQIANTTAEIEDTISKIRNLPFGQ